MKRILIVEDDPVTAKIYSSHLTRAGYEVTVATDGQQGLAEIDRFKPEGCLIDFMLPNLNGFELVKRVRAHPDHKNSVLVVYSNAVVPHVKQLAEEAGVSSLFDKADLTPAMLLQVFKSEES